MTDPPLCSPENQMILQKIVDPSPPPLPLVLRGKESFMREESIIILPFSPSLFIAAILFLRKKKTIKQTAPKAMDPANTELAMMPTVKNRREDKAVILRLHLIGYSSQSNFKLIVESFLGLH